MIEQPLEEMRAENDAVRHAKALLEAQAQRDALQEGAGQAVADMDFAWREGVRRNTFPGAKPLQRRHGIGTELQPGAHLLKCGRSFKQVGHSLPVRARPSAAARPAMPPPTTRKGESIMAYHAMPWPAFHTADWRLQSGPGGDRAGRSSRRSLHGFHFRCAEPHSTVRHHRHFEQGAWRSRRKARMSSGWRLASRISIRRTTSRKRRSPPSAPARPSTQPSTASPN